MAYSKKWLALTPEQRKEKRKGYKITYEAKNPQKILESERKYREKNKVKNRVYQRIRQKDKHRTNKLKAIEYKGGKCFDCNNEYPQCCYDFHHIDPNIKDSTIAQITGRQFENIISELDKCVLLCSNCHRIRHFNDNL